MKATTGREGLGGLEYDKALVDYCVTKWMQANPHVSVDPRNNPKAMSRLLQAANRTKQVLSTVADTFLHM